VQLHGCDVLQTLIDVDAAAFVSAVVSAGGVDVVLSAMRRHCDSGAMQARGCSVMKALVSNSSPSSSHAVDALKLVAASGIDAVVSAMRRHVDCVGVQGCALSLLGSLVTLATSSASLAVVTFSLASGGVVGDVLAAMRRHPASDAVQGCGCGVLGSLADYDTVTRSGRACVPSHGVVDAVVDAMRCCPQSRAVQVSACGALLRIAIEYRSRTPAVPMCSPRRVIDAVLCAMRAHTDVVVHELGCGVLSELVAAAVELRVIDVIDAVLHAMRCHEASVTVQERGCATLLPFVSTGSDADGSGFDALPSVVEAGAVDVVLSMMQRRCGRCQRRCCA
jgi:hypothetical protein